MSLRPFRPAVPRWFAACRLLAIVASASAGAASAAPLTVTVTHDLPIARPAETISVPWSAVARALPGALLHHLAVRDATGRILAYQVTNIAPEAKDPQNRGVAYGELLFQHDFAAGERSATFTVEKIDAVAPVFPAKVFARHVPERLDDFAWENDLLAHRTYGPALAAPDTARRGKEVLVTSGLDVWCKRVPYLVVDRWYNVGHDHYHRDEGEGLDMYQVGTSRGCGGTGLWDGRTLHVGRNYQSWSIAANGPIRASFTLTYAAWDAGPGMTVSEVKRFTVDAGHAFDVIDSTFTLTGTTTATIALGLNKNSGDKGEDSVATVSRDPAAATLAQWEVQRTHGSLGTAVLVERAAFAGFAEDAVNQLLLVRVTSGQTVRCLAGAGWSLAGAITTREQWLAAVAAESARLASPVKVSFH